MPIIVDPASSTGASLTLEGVWLNATADPADFVALRTYRFAPSRAVPGEVRQLAGGRRRLVVDGGAARSIAIGVRRPDAATRQWLDNHAGELLCVRDPDGGKFFGTYLELGYARTPDGEDDLDLELTEVSYSEAV